MWHQGSIVKLITYKFPDYLILILRNFLTDRKFQVRVNHILSSVSNIQAGIPQGSSLNPTLYNIFNWDFLQNDEINYLCSIGSASLTQGSKIKFVIQTLQVHYAELKIGASTGE
ncbi:hypothetical protein AVEN_82542-1 [Araneus ventricosus]|uniref:Uncharacterized protein n=1 Tax=Araneus ventricosus TaxID=182803 RepID=A0A4Y2SSX6_ARAVE|nr:hypothetical protein AVEN_82542-1 [Araneus ventricosus]